MKNCKGILLMVILFCVNNMFGSEYRAMPLVPAITITSILNGVLGVDEQNISYAWKANAINRYNYSNAARRGSVNLWNVLEKDIRNVNLDVSLDQMGKIQALRGTINSLYNALEKYKTTEGLEVSRLPQSQVAVRLVDDQSSQNEPIVTECSICLEEKPTVQFPCKNGYKHTERICQSCLDNIVKPIGVCPICREELLKKS